MNEKKQRSPERRVLVVVAVYLLVILSALILCLTNQIAGWVAQMAIAFSLLRLVFLFGWGAAKNGWRWRA